jgi:hypothetical protein
MMNEEISDYDLLIQEPEEQTAVTPPDEQSAVVEPPADSVIQPTDTTAPKSEFEGFEGIATPDGKRVIPFSRLNDEIKSRVEAETKYSDLVQQIESFKQTQGVANPVLPQEAIDKLAELEEYDQEAAAVLRKTLQETLAVAQTASQRAAQLEQQEAAKQQQTAAQVEAQQQAIIESYPNLKAMQQSPEQWAQAGKVYDSFYENPVTAQLSDADKIAKLNDVMTAMLGTPAQPQTKVPAAVIPQPAPAQVFSLSDLGSGVIPPAATGQKDPLEMSSSELQAYWARTDYDEFGR